ncbi:hypothetical protein B0H10DRAFT_2188513 [Mycena sp. CBHHK59/15]|nr:hypothetical protein B0H10DRAFT_2188513 [Mycena sp. CBHHK59/15]
MFATNPFSAEKDSSDSLEYTMALEWTSTQLQVQESRLRITITPWFNDLQADRSYGQLACADEDRDAGVYKHVQAYINSPITTLNIESSHIHILTTYLLNTMPFDLPPQKIGESDATIVVAQAEPAANEGRELTSESASEAEPHKIESAKIKDTSESDEIERTEPPKPPGDVPRGKINNTTSGKPAEDKPRPPPSNLLSSLRSTEDKCIIYLPFKSCQS